MHFFQLTLHKVPILFYKFQFVSISQLYNDYLDKLERPLLIPRLWFLIEFK